MGNACDSRTLHTGYAVSQRLFGAPQKYRNHLRPRISSSCPTGARRYWSTAVGEIDLTLVVPFYNPGPRLKPHISDILRILRKSGLTFEVIPVSDGSTDGSDARLEDLGIELGVLRLPRNEGKGNALRLGFSRGRGRYLGFIDGDGDIPAQTLESFIELIRQQQPDMIIASKWHPDSEVVGSPVRRVYSWTFQLLVRTLLQVDVTDTQAGLKLIRRDVLLRALLMLLRRKGFSWTLSSWPLRGDGVFKHYRAARTHRNPADKFDIRWFSSLDGVQILALAWKIRGTPYHFDRAFDRGKQLAASQRDDIQLAEQMKADDKSTRPLSILIYNWRDLAHPNGGGAEVWTHKVASAWVRFGHVVTIFCAGVDGHPEIEDIDGVRYVRRGNRHSVYRLARRYYRRECRGRFDLVIDEVNTRPFGCASWVRDTPVVAVVHQLAREVWF